MLLSTTKQPNLVRLVLDKPLNAYSPRDRAAIREARISLIADHIVSTHSLNELRQERIRFTYDDAQEIAQRVQRRGVSLLPYDLPSVWNIWHERNAQGTLYRTEAFGLALHVLARMHGASPTVPKGFAKILPYILRETFDTLEINGWGTKITSMYRGAPSRTFSLFEVLHETITTDPSFNAIQAIGVKEYDLPQTSPNYWKEREGTPTQVSREVMGIIVSKIAEQDGAIVTPRNVKKYAACFNRNYARDLPLNYWGTTARSMLRHGYNDQVEGAIKDFIAHFGRGDRK